MLVLFDELISETIIVFYRENESLQTKRAHEIRIVFR